MNIVMEGHSLSFIGGMERVTCDLASHMSRRGHKVFLFTSDPSGAVPVYRLHESVTVVHATHGGRRKHLEAFQQQILNCAPDVCISSATDRRHWPWCAALRGTGIPLIVSEHSTPEAIEHQLWNREERLAVMACADAVHVLLASHATSLPEFLKGRVCVISNALTMPAVPHKDSAPLAICTMGRLSYEKQNHILVDAFSQLASDFPEWQVHIWGKGPEYGRLASQIVHAGLKDRVLLRGATNSPQLGYAEASIVCMPSFYEGFGCVITESMSVGIPAVGFAQCPGVNELIQHGTTGLLVSEMTAVSLAAALRSLMENENLRRRMGAAAREAAKVFAPDTIYDMWEQVVYHVSKSKGRTQMQALEQAGQEWPELRAHADVFRHCTQRFNLLVGDGQYLRSIIFQFPWLKRMLHPVYTWLKCKRAAKQYTASRR